MVDTAGQGPEIGCLSFNGGWVGVRRDMVMVLGRTAVRPYGGVLDILSLTFCWFSLGL